MELSPNFTLEEMVLSQTALRKGFDNTPGAEQVENLERLCETLLEPVRWMLSAPLRVNSGFRSPALNEAVGGAHNSAHMDGRAADVVPIGVNLRVAFDRIRATQLPYDQVIIECNAWIHLAIARKGETARRQALVAVGGPGNWHYQEVKDDLG